MNFNYDVIVIGGGSAGMAAALKAREQTQNVLLIERNNVLGGILNQCVHNGFGLNYFKAELTGPEYASAFVQKVKQTDIQVMLETTVVKIKENKNILSLFSKEHGGYIVETLSPVGKVKFSAKAIVLAMGCRERPAGAINLCGTRPAGVLSAGCAQKLINIYGKKVGKKAVIIGSGDIGLIMARRMLFEGTEVVGVYEVQSYPSGLKRNIVQCLDDYNIPLHLSKTIVEVVGDERVEGVYVAPVNADFSFDLTKKEFVECDTVILSVGLVPENTIASDFGIVLDDITGGAIVDENLETNKPGIFACGNVLHVHDIVDNVSVEAEACGSNAGKYAEGKLSNENSVYKVNCGYGVRYTVPKTIYEGGGVAYIRFRVSKVFENAKLVVVCDGKEIVNKDKPILLPAEMETLVIDKSKITGDITILVKEGR